MRDSAQRAPRAQDARFRRADRGTGSSRQLAPRRSSRGLQRHGSRIPLRGDPARWSPSAGAPRHGDASIEALPDHHRAGRRCAFDAPPDGLAESRRRGRTDGRLARYAKPWASMFSASRMRDQASRWGSCSAAGESLLFLAADPRAALRARLCRRPRSGASQAHEPRPALLAAGADSTARMRASAPRSGSSAHGRTCTAPLAVTGYLLLSGRSASRLRFSSWRSSASPPPNRLLPRTPFFSRRPAVGLRQRGSRRLLRVIAPNHDGAASSS